MPLDNDAPKLCLSCARRALAGKPPKACGSCPLINTDPLAKVRAISSRPWPPPYYTPVTITPRMVAER